MNDKYPSQFSQCESVLIAGNGPSLAQIDYNRLPAEIDIFRCNQFYFEEQYYVGKQIKAAFFHNVLFLEQQATLSALQQNDEYQCEQIVYSDLENQFYCPQKTQSFLHLFPDTLNLFPLYREKLPELAKHTLHLALFHNQVPTSAVIMAITAVVLGYRKLYFAGLDLYAGTGQTYAFDSNKTNLSKLIPEFKSDHIAMNKTWHNAQTDLSVLHLLQKLYGVEIYSVSPSSPLSEHFPLAPETGLGETNHSKMCFAKTESSLKDIVIPDSAIYRHFRQLYHPTPDPVAPLKNNLIYRLIHDLLQLPNHINKYLRQKRQKKQP